MQGFFVHVTNGTYPVTANLTVNNNARNTTLTGLGISTQRPKRNDIRLAVSQTAFSFSFQKPIFRLFAQYSEETSDPMVVYLDQKTQSGFDPQFDALKLMNTDESVPNIYSLSSDNQRLSILALNSADTGQQIVPLGLKLSQDGNITFEATNIETFSFPYIYLLDGKSNQYYELHQNPKVSLGLSKGTYEGRFSLIFSFKSLSPVSASSWNWTAYSYQETVYIKLEEFCGLEGDLKIYSVSGEPVWSGKLSGLGLHSLNPQVRSGIYILYFQSSKGVFTKKVFIGL